MIRSRGSLRKPARLRRSALLLAVVAAAGLLGGAAQARPAHSVSNEIFFYSDLANSINGPFGSGTPVLRPALILLREDGSIVVEHVHWSTWGGAVARAGGTYSASDCTPNCAQGHRTNSPAQLTLSKPGRVLGRRVYRCVRLAVPSQGINSLDCLERSGKLIAYGAVAVSKKSVTYARFLTPSGNIACEMADTGTSQASVGCIIQKPPAIAQLDARGVVKLCQHQGLKCAGNLGEPQSPPRKLAYGHSIQVGRFRCTSALTGVTCLVTATGKGFFISKQSVRRVG